ncbi:MAG: isochorismate synthase MenF [Haloarculaceae archaeon]
MDLPRGDETPVRASNVSFVTRGRRVEAPPVRTLLSTVEAPRIAWETGEETVVAGGAAATITAAGEGRFETVRARARDLFEGADSPESASRAARPRLFGGFAFHEGDGDGDSPWAGFPDALFVLPAVQVTGVDGEWWLTTTAAGPEAAQAADRRLAEWADRLAGLQETPSASPPGVASRERTPSRAGWRDQVEAALERVADGSLEKVVLAQALRTTLAGDLSVPDALARVSEAYPDCYRFVIEPPGAGTFFGATPERLVSVRGRTVRTAALAGSTGRGDTPAEDEWLRSDLLDSAKDRHEHELVVEAIRDQLAPSASTVRTSETSVRRLATVQHLRTPITADLAADEHVLSLVEALHPTPAVGGLPPDRALRTIRESEAFDRGWYAAPVGWIDGAGDGTFAVAIRSALARDRTATLFAGAGIVADSDPDSEWDEVQLKYRPILDALE